MQISEILRIALLFSCNRSVVKVACALLFIIMNMKEFFIFSRSSAIMENMYVRSYFLFFDIIFF